MADIANLNVIIGANIDSFERSMREAERGIGRLGQGLKTAGAGLTAAITLPLGLLGGAALAASAQIDALRRGLQAVTQQQLGEQGVTGIKGIAQASIDTKARLLELRQVAALPGLGFAEAIQGDIRLRAVGISADLSKRALLAFGNAIATTGGGKGELDRVTVQLGQLSAKGKVLSQDLRPIIEAAPAVATALKKLYGTVDSETISKSLEKQGKSSTEFISVLTDELGKLPKVTGGLKNAFENLADSGQIGLAKLGDSLNKAFNIEGNLGKLGDFVARLADSFEALEPSTQKTIFVFAGMAAAAGPLLFAIGAIGAAIPAITAGFALLTGPILLGVAAFAALAVGVALVASSGKDATAEFRAQAASVKTLTETVSPLLTRYDALKAKTTLTKAEQEELRSIIEKVGKQIPASITAFDNYGRALDINSEKARGFLKVQQQILAVKNKEAIQEQREAYRALTGQIQETINALGEKDAKGNLTKDIAVTRKVGEGYETVTKTVQRTGDEIAAMQAKLADLQNTRAGVEGLINELEGIRPPLEETGTAADKAKPKLVEMSDKARKAAEKQLLALQKLNEGYDEMAIRAIKGLTFPSLETPDFALKLPALTTPLPTALTVLPGFDTTALAASSEAARQSYQKLSDAEKAAYQGTLDFNTNMGAAVEQLSVNIGPLLADFAVQFGDAFGSIITGTASVGDALTNLFGGILQSIGGFMKQFGAQLIAIGVGKIALETLFKAAGTGPLAIAAGVALVALGGVASAVGRSASSSVGSIARGGSAGGGGAPTPTSFTPTVAPNASAPGGPVTVTHNVVFNLQGNNLLAAIDIETDRLGRVVGRR